jgi:mono/diheme cytochrome c family protein
MHRRLGFFAAVFVFAASVLSGCLDSAAGSRGGAPLPCDVEAVVAARCGACHGASPAYGAPMPLVTPADFAAPAHSNPNVRVAELVAKRIHDDARPMPPPPNERLSAEALATLDAWIKRDLPPRAEDTVCPGQTDGGVVTSVSCTPDVHVAPTSPWTMSGMDTYACYRFDPTPGRATTAIVPRVDNKKIVHHMILFIAKDATVGTAPQGGCEAEMSALWRMVYGWAPGGQPLTLPPDVGLQLAPDEHFVLQVHYSNPDGLVDAKDTTGVDLCTTSTPPKYEADVMAFGSTKFTIPPRGKLDLSCEYTIPPTFGTFHVIATLPHMHQLGTSTSNVLFKGGNREGLGIDLGAVPNWDFGLQLWKVVTATIAPGDVVRTKCSFINPTDREVKQGENTADEMCLDFALYYPRAPILSWAQPAYASTCTK